MHSLNLVELVMAGARAGGGQEMLDDLLAIGIWVTERPDGEALRLANLRASSGLKLPDCCVLDTALYSGSPLTTFDERLAKAARERHITVAPAPGCQASAAPSR